MRVQIREHGTCRRQQGAHTPTPSLLKLSITMDSFRKIDIDKYDEDVLLEEELVDVDQRNPSELSALAKQRATEVRSLVGRGDSQNALALLLSDPPYGEANSEAKVSTL